MKTTCLALHLALQGTEKRYTAVGVMSNVKVSFGNNSPIRDKIVAEMPSISKMELKNRQNKINLKDFVPPRKKKKLNAVNG